MAALRLMTFNVQCLPMIAGALDGTISLPGLVLGLVPGSDSDAIDRAQSIVDALVALAADERPHVIALNEVFHEDARRTFLDGLSGDWPYVVESVHEGDLEEDSGLMVFSSLAFLNLGGTDRRELFYRDDAGADVWASKAAVLVQVGVPELTTLVFTHLQAAYDTDSQYRDVRAAQLAEIVDGLLRPELGDYPEAWSDVIVAGDLNIRGDADAEGDEWETTFATPDGEFGSIFVDSWVEMRPPGVDADLDPGLTHRDRASQVGQRLDYITHLRRTDGPRLLPHAMRIGHRSLSDHVALEAVLQHETRHCQPSSALELDAMTVIAGGAPAQPVGSVARYAHVDLTRDDERFWVWMPRVGTYTFFAGTDLAYDVYAATDISHPLERLADLVAGEVPPYLENAVLELRGSIDPVGELSSIASRCSWRSEAGPVAGCSSRSSCSNIAATRRRPRSACRRITMWRSPTPWTRCSVTTMSAGSGSSRGTRWPAGTAPKLSPCVMRGGTPPTCACWTAGPARSRARPGPASSASTPPSARPRPCTPWSDATGPPKWAR